MRREPTRAEDRLWWAMRNRKYCEQKFRRQVPIGPFIVDFYCAALKLVIEMDGGHHEEPDMNEYDSSRTEWLQEHGLTVLRIPNETLRNDPRLVEQIIKCAIADLSQPPHPPSAPSPPCRGRRH